MPSILLADGTAHRHAFGNRLECPRPLGPLLDVAGDRLYRGNPGRRKPLREVGACGPRLGPRPVDLRQHRLPVVQAGGRQALETAAGVQRGVAPSGFLREDWLASRRVGGSLRRRGIVERAHQRARPLGRGLVLRSVGDVLERRPVRQPLHRPDRHVLELAAQGHGGQLVDVVDPGQRRLPDAGMAGAARHRSEGAGLLEPIERGTGHRLAGGGPRHDRDVLGVRKARQRRKALALLGPLERADCQVHEESHRLLPHVVVGILLARLGNHRGRQDLSQGRYPDAGVPVLAGDGDENVLLIERQFFDGRGADGRVGVLPAGLRAELVEKTHERASPGCESGKMCSGSRCVRRETR